MFKMKRMGKSNYNIRQIITQWLQMKIMKTESNMETKQNCCTRKKQLSGT